jgi:hypothetical protein
VRTITGHAGQQTLAALRSFGVDTMFTLNGGHVWPFYEAARDQGVRIVDTRHEQTATFAAEAYAKLTRSPGLAVLTAGPGITNGVSAMTTAWFNGSPLVVLGGRAPQGRWGAGSLQELDHVPIVSSVTKHAATVTDPSKAGLVVHEAAALAMTPHRGPVFLDFPLDVFGPAEGELPDTVSLTSEAADPAAVERAIGPRRLEHQRRTASATSLEIHDQADVLNPFALCYTRVRTHHHRFLPVGKQKDDIILQRRGLTEGAGRLQEHGNGVAVIARAGPFHDRIVMTCQQNGFRVGDAGNARNDVVHPGPGKLDRTIAAKSGHPFNHGVDTEGLEFAQNVFACERVPRGADGTGLAGYLLDMPPRPQGRELGGRCAGGWRPGGIVMRRCQPWP